MDVFLSYAHKDRGVANQVRLGLERNGFSVWWDESIPTASRWRDVIEPALNAARCVVVLWSPHSVTSKWVIQEAQTGYERSVLVPARLAAVEIPTAAAEIQAADLTTRRRREDVNWIADLADSVRRVAVPVIKVTLDSLTRVNQTSMEKALESVVGVAARLYPSLLDGRYDGPRPAEEGTLLHRMMSTIPVDVEWAPELTSLLNSTSDQAGLRRLIDRVQRRWPLLWLDLLYYSGPWQQYPPIRRSHEQYFVFANTILYHYCLHHHRHGDTALEPPAQAVSSSPIWELTLPHILDREYARAYVNRIDNSYVPEVVIYGPKELTQEVYKRPSFNEFLLPGEIEWYEEYFIPQYELHLSQKERSPLFSHTGGLSVHVRKATDMDGQDLPF